MDGELGRIIIDRLDAIEDSLVENRAAMEKNFDRALVELGERIGRTEARLAHVERFVDREQLLEDVRAARRAKAANALAASRGAVAFLIGTGTGCAGLYAAIHAL